MSYYFVDNILMAAIATYIILAKWCPQYEATFLQITKWRFIFTTKKKKLQHIKVIVLLSLTYQQCSFASQTHDTETYC